MIPDLESLPQRVMQDLLSLNPITIFLSGSQYDGFGHRDSDIDVFVITDDDSSMSTGNISTDFDDEGVRIDLEFWSIQKLYQVCDSLDSYPGKEFSQHHLSSVTPRQRDMLHRFVIGQPIFGQTAFHKLRARINTRALSVINYWTAYQSYQGHQEDALGLISIEDYHSALISTQACLEASLDALIAARGDNNLGRKWRLRKLHRNALGSEAELYLSFFKDAHHFENTPKAFLQQYIRLANDIALKAQI